MCFSTFYVSAIQIYLKINKLIYILPVGKELHQLQKAPSNIFQDHNTDKMFFIVNKFDDKEKVLHHNLFWSNFQLMQLKLIDLSCLKWSVAISVSENWYSIFLYITSRKWHSFISLFEIVFEGGPKTSTFYRRQI